MATNPSTHRRTLFPSCGAKNHGPAKCKYYRHSHLIQEEMKQEISPINNAESLIKDLWLSIVTLFRKEPSFSLLALNEAKKCTRSESVSTVSSDTTDYSALGQEREKQPPLLSFLLFSDIKSCRSSNSMPIQSILRSTNKYSCSLLKTDSVTGTVLSLVETSNNEESSRRTFEGSPADRKVSFDPRIWIREFQRTRQETECTWYTTDEMEEFVGKHLALERILRYNSIPNSKHQLLSTGTGRTLLHKKPKWNGPIYSYAALALDKTSEAHMKKRILEQELRSVLILDPHDLCRRLLAETLRAALPQETLIATVSSSQDALNLLEGGKRFDLILVEERLWLFQNKTCALCTDSSSRPCSCCSGSTLLEQLSSNFQQTNRALLIGLSAHLLEDAARLKRSGADFCWSKPPPPMDNNLVEDLVKALLVKRNKSALVADLYL